MSGFQNVEEDPSSKYAHEDSGRSNGAPYCRIGHDQIEAGLLDYIRERCTDCMIGAVDGWKVSLAEQERNAIFDYGAAERIANAGATVAQRDIFTAGTPFFVELIRQNIVQLAIEYAP